MLAIAVVVYSPCWSVCRGWGYECGCDCVGNAPAYATAAAIAAVVDAVPTRCMQRTYGGNRYLVLCIVVIL